MNQEQNNLNPNNFNTQGNNGIPNNQSLNNQNFNQGMGVNQQTINPQPQQAPSFQQPINQMNMQQPTPQPMNTFNSGNANNHNFNSKPPKKMNLGLIIGIISAIAVIVITGLLIFSKSSNQTNHDIQNSNGNTNTHDNVVYYDNLRDIKPTYTFDEATSKFAFKNFETTLIFDKKNNIQFYETSLGKWTENIVFFYQPDDFAYYFDFKESGSSDLNDFIEKFKNGNLNPKLRQLSFENIKILESTQEYVFISCKETGNILNQYYFAKKIGNKVFYANESLYSELDDNTKNILLTGFKNLFNSLLVDDNKEPYICDKILNVPLVLNKQIKSYKLINNIESIKSYNAIKYYGDYIKGNVKLINDDNKWLNIYYDAEQFYNKTPWDKNITSKIKYSEKSVHNALDFGIKENNNTQVFNIRMAENIKNETDFNEYINNFFN